MERKFYADNFESLLKENADQFKMTPSKKVWHGIYNDMHPGRRWPSVAISLLLILTLVMVGYLNTQQSEHNYLTTIGKDAQHNNTRLLKPGAHQAGVKSTVSSKTSIAKHQVAPATLAFAGDVPVQAAENLHAKQTAALVPATGISLLNGADMNAMNADKAKETENIYAGQTGNLRSATIQSPELKDFPNAAAQIQSTVGIDNAKAAHGHIYNRSEGGENVKGPVTARSEANTKSSTGSAGETQKQAPRFSFLKKIYKNSKVSWSYYLSSGVSYRNYSTKRDEASAAVAGLIYSNADLSRAVKHRPSPGFEAGTAMKYSLSKTLKFTSGFQVNYSRYSVEANNIHPIMATLLLYNDKTEMPYSISSISYYGNGPGTAPIKLHNYSVQVSLPVGMELKIAGNDDVQLGAAASLQPAFIITNQAYLLSTDKQNYLTEADLSRRWNIGTNVGTFVSINSNKFQWQIGPQMHYQLLSSYKSAYHLKEHIIDYSIRLGISRLVK